ncbi:hypothetical protein LDENG_00123250 [Lucifuga dentata]|nr:hypothetical protein LDENG_00123250 [Lucifuga dentata]
MGQHLGKKEPPTDSKASSPEPKVVQRTAVEPESQDEVFGKRFYHILSLTSYLY